MLTRFEDQDDPFWIATGDRRQASSVRPVRRPLLNLEARVLPLEHLIWNRVRVS